MLRYFAFAGLLLALLLSHVAAQQPTQAQRDAIRAACRSDFMANCSGVQPGGKEAFECLLQNDAKLSPSCQAAVSAVAPKPSEPPAAAVPAPAAPASSETAPPPNAKAERAPPGIQVAPAETQNEALKTVQQACTLNDLVAHCSGIAPNNPEILQCLKANAADLSPNCQTAVQSLPASPPAAAAPPPAEPARQAAPAKKPVEPKPAEPASGAAAAAPAPIGPMPMLRPREALAIVQICGAEVRTLCAGTPPGGGRLISCLAAHASSLSPSCYGALSAAAQR